MTRRSNLEAVLLQWPKLPGQPRPRIPPNAWERATQFDDRGRKRESEFWLGSRLVGRASWSPDGPPLRAVGLENGKLVGPLVEFHRELGDGVSFAQMMKNGLPHGYAKQWDRRGRLMLATSFRNGTGLDLWCDEEGRLTEERSFLSGERSGIERWWNQDGRTVSAESEFQKGVLHGVAREWTGAGKLRRGFPRFFVRGEVTTKAQYQRMLDLGAALPAYLEKDDSPQRAKPRAFREARERARRLRRPQGPSKQPPTRLPQRVVFGAVVAERRYQAGSEWVLLQIGMPRRWSRWGFYCPVRLVGSVQTRVDRAIGVDSVQALQLALGLAKVRLETSGTPMWWFAAECLGDVGIERTINGSLGHDETKRLEAKLDSMVFRRTEQLSRYRRLKR